MEFLHSFFRCDVPESKTRPGRLWIIGSVFGFWDVFCILGSVLGFWNMFWILGSVFGFWDVFWILGRVLDSGKCFVPMSHCSSQITDTAIHLLSTVSREMGGPHLLFGLLKISLLLALITPNADRLCQNIFSLIDTNITTPYVLYLL